MQTQENNMENIVVKIGRLVEDGLLTVEGVVIATPYEIELGADNEQFDGEIKLHVKYDGDVIQLSNLLIEASKK